MQKFKGVTIIWNEGGRKCDWKGIIKGKEETNDRVVYPKPRNLLM